MPPVAEANGSSLMGKQFAVVDYPYGEKSATFLKRISKEVTAAAKDAGMLK